MPERMTAEERQISMAIEKARDAKQILYQSLMDNNRSELEDESEAVKVTRPKAENVNLEMKPQGTHSGFGLGSHATAGDSLKKSEDEKDQLFYQNQIRTILKDLEKAVGRLDKIKNLSKYDRIPREITGNLEQIQDMIIRTKKNLHSKRRISK